MKRIVSLLLIVTMLLTMAFTLSGCVTEKIVYVTESKEDKDDDVEVESKEEQDNDTETESKEDQDDTESEPVESESADESDTPSQPPEDVELTAITAEEFMKFFEEKGFSTTYREDNQVIRAEAKKDPETNKKHTVEVKLKVYENEDAARYEFWRMLSDIFDSYENASEHGELFRLTPNIVIISRWEKDGPKTYRACVWIEETVLTYYVGYENSYSDMIENLIALGYYE